MDNLKHKSEALGEEIFALAKCMFHKKSAQLMAAQSIYMIQHYLDGSSLISDRELVKNYVNISITLTDPIIFSRKIKKTKRQQENYREAARLLCSAISEIFIPFFSGEKYEVECALERNATSVCCAYGLYKNATEHGRPSFSRMYKYEEELMQKLLPAFPRLNR